jgi:hypothetical protein
MQAETADDDTDDEEWDAAPPPVAVESKKLVRALYDYAVGDEPSCAADIPPFLMMPLIRQSMFDAIFWCDLAPSL